MYVWLLSLLSQVLSLSMLSGLRCMIMLCMISRRILSFAHYCFLYSVCVQITSSCTNLDFSQCELCVIYVTYWWQLDHCMTNFPEFCRYSVLTSVEVLAGVRCFCELFCFVQNYEIMSSLLHKGWWFVKLQTMIGSIYKGNTSRKEIFGVSFFIGHL